MKFLLFIFFLLSYSASFSQSGNVKVYYPHNIEINYFSEYTGVKNNFSDKKNFLPLPNEQYAVNVLNFENDSMINVSGENFSNVSLNINKINSIRVCTGSYSALGIGLGVLGGVGITGIALATSKKTPDIGEAIAEATGYVILGVVSIVGGAIIGGIIGGNISSYDNYDMTNNKLNKKKEIERILKADEKENKKRDGSR